MSQSPCPDRLCVWWWWCAGQLVRPGVGLRVGGAHAGQEALRRGETRPRPSMPWQSSGVLTRVHVVGEQEMVRVLKPGGTLVIACWCQVRPRRVHLAWSNKHNDRYNRKTTALGFRSGRGPEVLTCPLVCDDSVTTRPSPSRRRSGGAWTSCAPSGATRTSSPSRWAQGQSHSGSPTTSTGVALASDGAVCMCALSLCVGVSELRRAGGQHGGDGEHLHGQLGQVHAAQLAPLHLGRHL